MVHLIYAATGALLLGLPFVAASTPPAAVLHCINEKASVCSKRHSDYECLCGHKDAILHCLALKSPYGNYLEARDHFLGTCIERLPHLIDDPEYNFGLPKQKTKLITSTNQMTISSSLATTKQNQLLPTKYPDTDEDNKNELEEYPEEVEDIPNKNKEITDEDGEDSIYDNICIGDNCDCQCYCSCDHEFDNDKKEEEEEEDQEKYEKDEEYDEDDEDDEDDHDDDDDDNEGDDDDDCDDGDESDDEDEIGSNDKQFYNNPEFEDEDKEKNKHDFEKNFDTIKEVNNDDQTSTKNRFDKKEEEKIEEEADKEENEENSDDSNLNSEQGIEEEDKQSDELDCNDDDKGKEFWDNWDSIEEEGKSDFCYCYCVCKHYNKNKIPKFSSLTSQFGKKATGKSYKLSKTKKTESGFRSAIGDQKIEFWKEEERARKSLLDKTKPEVQSKKDSEDNFVEIKNAIDFQFATPEIVFPELLKRDFSVEAAAKKRQSKKQHADEYGHRIRFGSSFLKTEKLPKAVVQSKEG